MSHSLYNLYDDVEILRDILAIKKSWVLIHLRGSFARHVAGERILDVIPCCLSKILLVFCEASKKGSRACPGVRALI